MEIVYAWIASVASGISPLIIKATTKTLNPWLFNVLWVALGIPLVSIYAFLLGGGVPTDWLSLILLSSSFTLLHALLTFSYCRLDVTTISPLFSLQIVFSSLLGVFLLNEPMDNWKAMLIALIVLASPLIAYDETQKIKSFLNLQILFPIIAITNKASCVIPRKLRYEYLTVFEKNKAGNNGEIWDLEIHARFNTESLPVLSYQVTKAI